MRQAVVEALDQALDGLRLVAGRLEVAVQYEGSKVLLHGLVLNPGVWWPPPGVAQPAIIPGLVGEAGVVGAESRPGVAPTAGGSLPLELSGFWGWVEMLNRDRGSLPQPGVAPTTAG